MPVVDVWHTPRPKPGATKCAEHGLYPSAKHMQGRRWAARYRDDTGTQKNPLFDRKQDATDAYNKAVGDLQRGEYVDRKGGKVKLRLQGESWLAAQACDISTRKNYSDRLRLHVYPTLGDLPLYRIKPSVVQAWIRGLEKDLAANYVRVIASLLSSVLQAAVDDGLLGKNPCRAESVKPPKLEQRQIVPWTVEWVDGVRVALPARWRGMVTVGGSIGLRQGEAFALAVEDIDFLRGWVHVRRQVKLIGGGKVQVFAPPKGGKERQVPLSTEVGLQLARHIEVHGTTEVQLPWKTPDGKPRAAKLLFTREDGRAHNRNQFNDYVWHPALQATKIPLGRENGMHALRHHFASVLLDGGVSIREIAEWLGHTDPGFTLRTYTHLMKRGEERMRLAIDQALKGAAVDGQSKASAPVVRPGVV